MFSLKRVFVSAVLLYLRSVNGAAMTVEVAIFLVVLLVVVLVLTR